MDWPRSISDKSAALGVKRQIFFAGYGNFDTHGNQLTSQSALLAQLSPALGAFYQATMHAKLPGTP
jgi:uncharacterized protein (DUF1501 family)